ncbi:cupin domain-containing protein [Thalassospiraceae bacterium LMO-JJ14]|nr:cupin domain-containing protein [Thalassospiraceae bacterium LMO-JJ14]
MQKVNFAEKFDAFDDHWRPKIVGSFDDYDIKLVKVEGDFVWHKHDDMDEVFIVMDGELNIDFRDGRQTLGSGEMIVVPRGVEHKPHATNECRMMLLERKGVVNTGDAEKSELTAPGEVRI